MTPRAELEAALRTVGRLADEHGRALDQAFRILADGALVGGHAVELERQMLVRHLIMREAFTGSFERIRQLASRDPAGPPRVPEPRIGRPPVGAAPAHGGAVGGDVALLDLLNTELGRAGRAWQDASLGLDRVLMRVGLDRLLARDLDEAGRWLVAQQPDLRRRRADLLKSDQVNVGAGLAEIALNLTTLSDLKPSDPKLAARLAAAGVDGTKIPLRGEPRSVSDWWRDLNEEQRALYIRAFPVAIGWLDGLPAVARNAANRLTLTNRLAALESRPPGMLSAFERRDLARLQKLRDQLAYLDAQATRIPGREAFLLGLDSTTPGPWDGYDPKQNPFTEVPGGNKVQNIFSDFTAGPDGRVIVAIGNPDNAVHTGIYVPGTSSQLDGLDLERIQRLWDETDEQAGGKPVSMITWLDYDAPDGIVADAPQPQYADDGGPKLDRFVNGVRAAQGEVHRHVTAIGHSYGSTVVGEAARTGNGLNVDDILVAGSPGMRVARATGLHMTPGRVWAQHAPGDPVPTLGRYGHGGWANAPWPRVYVPSDEDFGARRLTTDTQGHSNYWQVGSESLLNQARVVAGLHLNANPDDDPKVKP